MIFREDIEAKHPFLINKDFPFICTTPDFIFEEDEGKLSVAEVKSGPNKKTAKQIHARFDQGIKYSQLCKFSKYHEVRSLKLFEIIEVSEKKLV